VIALSLIAVIYIGFVRAGAAGYEEADRVLLDCAHGFRDLGAFVVYEIVRNTGSVQGAGMGLDGRWCRWFRMA